MKIGGLDSGGSHKRTKQNGGALVTVLAVSVVLSLLIVGIARYSLAHFELGNTEADHANAIQLAEAGVNYELRYISRNQTTGSPAHQTASPYTGSLTGVPGTFRVWVTNVDGSTPWAPPTAMKVRSEGTVNGVTRIVEVQGARNSIFDAFATYALQNMTFSGSGSQVNGGVGTNGTVTSPSSGAAAINGALTYGHAPTGSDLTGSNVYYGAPLTFPTIDQIIVTNPPSGFGSTGWAWLSSNSPVNRSNPLIRTFTASSPALTPSGTQAAGAPWTQTNANSVKIRPGDWSSLNAGPDGMKGLILPPGDYYFTDIDTGGGTGNKIIMDTAGLTTGTPGRVRIWMNDTGNNHNNDTINVNVYYTSTDPSLFRLYYNKCADINIGGNSIYYGGFYAVRTGCMGSITVGGNSTINGSVIGNYVSVQGGSVINFPGDGLLEDPGDFSLWFGFKNLYKEIAPTGGQLFPGGTNK